MTAIYCTTCYGAGCPCCEPDYDEPEQSPTGCGYTFHCPDDGDCNLCPHAGYCN